MTHIVQDLLTLSRFDSGVQPAQPDQVPLCGGIGRQLSGGADRGPNAMATSSYWRGTEGLPNVRGDRERILQVIMNILSNAIKYTPDGGRIVMSAGADRERVWLEVADNGIGIPRRGSRANFRAVLPGG